MPATRMNPNLDFAPVHSRDQHGRGDRPHRNARALAGRRRASVSLDSSPAHCRRGQGRAARLVFPGSRHGCAKARTAATNRPRRTITARTTTCRWSTFALFARAAAIARQVLEDARDKRLDAQIEPDGRQPLELARTRSFSYSVMNIDGLTQLATVGDRVGIDLWSYTRKGAKGPAIREALLIWHLTRWATRNGRTSRSAIGTRSRCFPFCAGRRRITRMRHFRRVIARVPPAAAADRTGTHSTTATVRNQTPRDQTGETRETGVNPL